MSTLKELEIGDRFYYPNLGKGIIFTVLGKPEFNRGAGTSTRVCLNEKTKMKENKQCRKDVIKLAQPTKNK